MTSIRTLATSFTDQFRGDRLRSRSMRGTVILTGAFGVAKILQLGSNLILTRILFPEAFGLMVLVTVFIGALQLISDVGVQPSVVRSHRGEDPDFLATAWTLMVFRGAWITGLAWCLAWPYALLYDQPLLFPLICVASLSSFVSGFKSVEIMVRSRNIALGRVVTLDLLSQAISIACTVLLAWWIQSVWGLAIGTVCGALANTLLSHVLLPSPNNRFRWDRSTISEILVFGRWILLGTFFTYMSGKGLKAINGYLVDLDVLSFLHIASLFGWMLGDLTNKILGSVGYPVLSRTYRESPDRLREVLSKLRLIQTSVTTPAFILMSLAAQPLINLLYDARYYPAGAFLSLMALNGAIGVLPMLYQNAMLSTGNSRVHAYVMAVSSALKISATFVGFYLGGPIGMIAALGVAETTTFLLSRYLWNRSKPLALDLDVINLAVIAVVYAYTLSVVNWSF
ncbi:oligosaccharide flippase family protein [Palleronia sp. LCG004]|uniref:oligosaccharide flippase family protein n=1 Tax=Palleronia sp. LCG004 TaxID=3079304 RepID=UPI00294349A1|nr:oligosaccharide flippase family protein [Palleronia sp. LCG004]WOI58402.1 oligosaccharide flippase family protein [Palleronia sp. LCG004]